MTDSRRFWVIRNELQAPCVSKKRADGSMSSGCGEVHEFMSHDCRPVAFTDPENWELFKTVVTRDVARTTQEVIFEGFATKFGQAIEITAKEAAELNVVDGPPADRLVVAVSRPGAPTRRR